jgi:hypothetical protein
MNIERGAETSATQTGVLNGMENNASSHVSTNYEKIESKEAPPNSIHHYRCLKTRMSACRGCR